MPAWGNLRHALVGFKIGFICLEHNGPRENSCQQRILSLTGAWSWRGTVSSSGQFKFYSFAKLWGKWANTSANSILLLHIFLVENILFFINGFLGDAKLYWKNLHLIILIWHNKLLFRWIVRGIILQGSLH